jgi:hypothetical protein
LEKWLEILVAAGLIGTLAVLGAEVTHKTAEVSYTPPSTFEVNFVPRANENENEKKKIDLEKNKDYSVGE